MTDENKWEYDYASLYRQNGAVPPENTGYVNAGSSGTNTANQNGYADAPNSNTAGQTAQPESQQTQTGGVQFEQAVHTDPQGGGTVPPQGENGFAAPAHPAHHRKYMTKAMANRVLTVVLAGVVGFVGGMAGARFGRSDEGRVVTYATQRPEGGTPITSTNGKNLSMTEVAQIVSPSVVVVTTEKMVASGGWYVQNRVISGAGSGVIMTEDGYILTNSHVVSGASQITVTINEENYSATLMGEDPESDIAVLKIDASGLTPAVMGDSDSLAVGEQVLAVGNPLGELGGTITNGIVSALNRNVKVEGNQMTLIQTNASVSPGNSGGGLFNMQGELIGIVNAKSSGNDAEGLGFAIPVNAAWQVASDLIENGYVSGRPAMGVTIVEVDTPEKAASYGLSNMGVYIYQVETGSAAERAGLQAGDRILSIDDVEITTSDTLTNYIKSRSVGDTVKLTVARSGKMVQVELVLSERSAPTADSAQQELPKTEN